MLRAIDALTRAEIILKMQALLSDFQPEEVYVTYSSDGHADHNATYLLVMASIKQLGLKLDVLEYPVWSIHNPRLNFNRPEFKNFYRLPIGKVRKQKIEAISCFRSQYVPIGGLTKTFLKRLSSPHEFFIKTSTLSNEVLTIQNADFTPLPITSGCSTCKIAVVSYKMGQPLFKLLKNVVKLVPEPTAGRYISKISPRLAEELIGFSDFPDRQFLKSTVFAYLIEKPEFQRILFVGCDWYTKAYETLFKGKDYWTLEIDKTKRDFGAAKHIIAPLQELDKYFAPDYFDAIICNSVFFKGAMDTQEDAERAFNHCFTRIRQDGLFVLGWNDAPEIYPYHIAESESLKRFTPYSFPPITADTYLTETRYRHTYSFFTK